MSEKKTKRVQKKRLCQVVGAESTKRTRCKKAMTKLHRISAQKELFNGFDRNYQPFNDEDPDIPEVQNRRIQQTAVDILERLKTLLIPLFDVTLTKDSGNNKVFTDLKVDGTVIAKDVPVPTILWLEDKLDDLHKFISSMPTLDPAHNWEFDENAGVYKTDEVETVRKVKQDKVIKLADATKEHPEQAQLVKEDIPVGKFSKVMKSGALHGKTKREILNRIEMLKQTAIEAREEANATKVEERELGEKFFEYVLAPLESDP